MGFREIFTGFVVFRVIDGIDFLTFNFFDIKKRNANNNENASLSSLLHPTSAELTIFLQSIMISTQTFSSYTSFNKEKEDYRTFSIQNEVYQWVFRHGLKRIVLDELMHQAQAFPPSKPSMRRKLMKEIRKKGLERFATSHSEETLPPNVAQTPRVQPSIYQQRMLQELMEYISRRENKASKNPVQDKRRRLLLSLDRQHSFRKISNWTKLLRAVRQRATERMNLHDRMHSIQQEFMEKVKHRIGHHIMTLPYREHYEDLKRELLNFVSRRKRFRHWKQVILMELLWQQSIFPNLGMRKQLMVEIRNFSLPTRPTQSHIVRAKSQQSFPTMTIHTAGPVFELRRTNSSAAA
jgi:hypothetical protein